jgi:lipopolysaccharide biosynthesis regulator YciM
MKIKLIGLGLLLNLNLNAQDQKLLNKADSGDSGSCDMVGIYMRNGSNGFKKDQEKAKEYFQKSSDNGKEQGNIYGDFMLGAMALEKGDDKKAYEIWAAMRAKNDAYNAKMKPQRDAREAKKKLKEMQDQIEALSVQQKKLKRRMDDVEYMEER